MKRLLAVILVFALSCGLFGCALLRGESKARVGVFWYQESDVYLAEVREYLNKKLKAGNLRYENYYAEGNQSKQIDQIKSALEEGADLLIVNQVTAGSLDTASNILTVAGDVPVIFFNRAIGPDHAADNRFFSDHANACFIGTDAPMAGHMQGELIGSYVRDHYHEIDLNGDGKISYAMFKGDNADISSILRTLYAVEDADSILVQSGFSELSYFDPDAPEEERYQADLEGTWSAAAAEAYMKKNLERFNHQNGNMIELVIANNDDMARGAVKALQDRGYNRPESRYIPVFGVDASPVGRKMIEEGTMTGTILQDAEGTAEAISGTALGAAEGLPLLEAMKALKDPRFSLAQDSVSRLNVTYSFYSE